MNPLFSSKQKRQLGREYPIKGEDQYIFEMVRDIRAQLVRLHGPGEMRRQAHPKEHGLVQAEFIVNPAELNEDLRVGVFAEKKRYPAWIRFSSFNTKIQPDYKKDVRGMAIKLTEVPGHKLLSAELHSETQDFLLVSNETFSAKNVHQFQKLVRGVTGGKKGILKFLANPLNWAVFFRAISEFVRVSNLLQIPYWSTTPYQFGSEDRAVKYHVVPRNANRDPMPKKPKDWYLREAMINTLMNQDVWFDFMVQFQEDPDKMPIEDATVKWKSPFFKLASIRIPKQQFATERELLMGKNMTFSPWHSLPEHRPLGGLNRARKAVYSDMGAFRLKQNQTQATNPILTPHRFQGKPIKLQPIAEMNNKQILEKMLAAFAQKDINEVMSYMDDDVIWFTQGDPKAIPFAGTHKGLKGVLAMFEMQAKTIKVKPGTFKLKFMVGADDEAYQVVVNP